MSTEESTKVDATLSSWQSMVRRYERHALEKALSEVGGQTQTKYQNSDNPNRYDLPKTAKPTQILGALNELKTRGFTSLSIQGSDSFQRRAAIYGEALGFQTNIQLSPHEKELAAQLASQRQTMLVRTSGQDLGRAM